MAKALQGGVASSGVFYESHLLQWVKGERDVAELMKEPQASFPAHAKNETLTNVATLPKEATSLIQQQLQTMEQQRFVWHGEVWPGQTMQWEISRDAPEHQNEQGEKIWQSAVSFSLPQLGSVSAQLQLVGTRLNLVVNTTDAAKTLMLQNYSNELIGALEASGAKLESLLIQTKRPIDE